MPFADDPVKWMRLGKVCQRAHALLNADSTLLLGQAIAKAAAQLDVTLSQEMESRMILTLGRVVMSGNDVTRAARNAGVLDGN